MTLTCFVCQKPENSAGLLALCHHCGRPVCREHRAWLKDPLFAAAGSAWELAAHCASCHTAEHAKLAKEAEPPSRVHAPPPIPDRV